MDPVPATLVAVVAEVADVAVAAVPANVLEAFENVTTPLSVCVPLKLPVIDPGPTTFVAFVAVMVGEVHDVHVIPVTAEHT